MSLPPAGQVLRCQETRPEQAAQRAEGLELGAEIRDIVSQFAQEVTNRQLLRLDAALATP
jgi:hypothetical protein